MKPAAISLASDTVMPPLVSIVALAYRSAPTIVETLESIAAQTHPRVELVLCDDGSPDDTVAKAEQWLAQHGNRLERVEIVRHSTNVGIVRNFDSGLLRCRGEWIKPIACDDLLVPDTIQTFLQQAERQGAEWMFSQCAKFTVKDGLVVELGDFVPASIARLLSAGDLATLRLRMLQTNVLPAPGAFYSRRFADGCGGLDMRLRHLDDWPLWLRALRGGRRPHWVPERLVRYRISSAAVTNNANTQAALPMLFPDEWRFASLYLREELPPLRYWDLRLHQWRKFIALHAFGNHRAALWITAPLQALSPLAWGRVVGKLIGGHSSVKAD